MGQKCTDFIQFFGFLCLKLGQKCPDFRQKQNKKLSEIGTLLSHLDALYIVPISYKCPKTGRNRPNFGCLKLGHLGNGTLLEHPKSEIQILALYCNRKLK